MAVKPVSFTLPSQKFYTFDMFEFNVEFDENYFHLKRLEQIDPLYHHDAYDADEDFTMFRAEAQFSLVGKDKVYRIPVYAYQDEENGTWKWKVRFQPDEKGTWKIHIWVLCFQPGREQETSLPLKNRQKLEQDYVYKGSDGKNNKSKFFYEFSYGIKKPSSATKGNAWPELNLKEYQIYPDGTSRVIVQDKHRATNQTNKTSLDDSEHRPMGPLSTPQKEESKNYFYRSQYQASTKKYERKPYFLFGVGRPWVIHNPSNVEEYIERRADLFTPMKKHGCNLLSQWLAPWETQLIHQCRSELWPVYQKKGKTSTFMGSFRGSYGYRLEKENWKKGYRRFDQGRAKHLDRIFSMSVEYDVAMLLSVFTHQSLEDAPHHWPEKGWGKNTTVQENPKDHKKKKYTYIEDQKTKKTKTITVEPIPPSKANGFQIFQHPARQGNQSALTINEFFQMNPKSPDSWKRKLWKHFSNYWRYIIARWGSHPALGAWVLIDEFEGVGEGTDWWTYNRDITFLWHSNVIKMIKNKMLWDESNSKWNIPYSGDYLLHPITTSNTEYERKHPQVVSQKVALNAIKTTQETYDYDEWKRTLSSTEDIDFYSHHIYQSAPGFGEWEYVKPLPKGVYQMYRKRVYRLKSHHKLYWKQPNSKEMGEIDAAYWLWNSFIYRMISWSKKHRNKPMLITEFGAYERIRFTTVIFKKPKELYTLPSLYGKIFPAYTHFAVWSCFILGHSGIPIKWNDGKELGEMKYKTKIIHRDVRTVKNYYPIDNYTQIEPLVHFFEEIKNDIDKLESIDSSKVSLSIHNGVAHYQKENDKVPTSITFPVVSKKMAHFLLASSQLEYAVIWFLDESFSKNLSHAKIKSEERRLNAKVSGSKITSYYYLVLSGFEKSKTYEYFWFDTWNGVFFKGKRNGEKANNILSTKTKSGKDGSITIDFPGFTKYKGELLKSIKKEADGNDLILLVKKI